VSDRKTERLINLTLALLATKRYLKKSEILESVLGYEGTQEAKERMFERDKDDLRSLGIEIEVGDLDVFFEDEPGYRIPQQSYELNMPELTGRELAILSIAANYWNDSILAPTAQSGIRKLQSLGIPISLDFDFKMQYRFENPTALLDDITVAISARSRISFSYDSISLKLRHVEPYRVVFWNGFWYLIGNDLDREDIRLFKLSRLVSPITIEKNKNQYLISPEFDARAYLPEENIDIKQTAKLGIRKDAGLILRNRGLFLEQDEEFDIYEIAYENENTFIREIVWHGTNVRIIQPIELRASLVKLLQAVSA